MSVSMVDGHIDPDTSRMTPKEVKKALECCIKAKTNADCEALKCPFYDNEIDICMYVNNEEVIYASALDLINRQQAELSDAHIAVKSYKGKYESAVKTAKELQTLVDELRHEREVLLEDIHHSADQINEQIEEIERLNSDLRIWKDIAYRETEYVEITESEAIKNYLETCEKTAISNAAKVAKAKFLEMAGEK